MRPAYAYLGIGLVFILAAIAFVNPGFMRSRDNGQHILDTASTSIMTFKLSSTAFGEGDSIPAHYSCDGAQASPPLSIGGAPEGTKTFTLIMEDPDVPKALKPDGVFLHWVVFNIPGSITEIIEGASLGISGENGAGKTGYVAPCPPPQYDPREHRYVFTLYALDKELALQAGAPKQVIIQAMQGHILGTAQLIGKYKRK